YTSGKLDEAFQAFQSAKNSATEDWEKAEAAYFLGKTLLDAGRENAGELFKAYLDEHESKKDWWVPHAMHGRAQAELALGRGNTANELFGRLESFGPVWKLRARIGQGRALHAAKSYLEARRAFDAVASDRSAPIALRHEAIAGRAEAFLAQEQYDNAIQELRDGFFNVARTGEIRYDRARAQATLLTGLAYKAKGSKSDLESAEIWLLKVGALYGTQGDLVERAAAALAEVYDGLGDPQRAARWRTRSK
ncbi:MAG TPA: hypothetical protein VK116_06325, partial [Planctomycetota bacterium]|nr:hypothetical protein [Planctomycetota bacterium]